MRKSLLLLGVALALPTAASAQVLISQYVEGSSNNKAIEIQNVSNTGIDQTTISIRNYANGSATPTSTYTLPSGTLAPGAVFVVANPSANATLLGLADATSGVMAFNGDDAVSVAISGTNVDVVGQIGVDPGTNWGTAPESTLDQTLTRTNSTPNPGTGAYDPATFFVGSAQNDFTGLGAGDTSLPVELASFTAAASGSSARLTWTTASETNNSGFVVERQTGDAWTDASALIAGHGTTTERHDYAYTATGLTAGRHTFRLRQIDTDGTVHYSATASVEVAVDGEGRVTLLGSRAVRVETNASQGVTVSVYDVLGRSVSSQAVSVDGTGVVELPSLASGAYVVRVVGERFAETRTLVVR